MNAKLDPSAHSWFFCGIGGSGMLPLAQIVHGLGGQVAGSDRSRDQGRTSDKFAWLDEHGFTLFPQDGSGITSADQIVVASAAVEDSVPEIVKARALGCRRMTRAELLAALFNRPPGGIGIAGTSGKSTVTGMIGWILAREGYDPTIMNGAVMKNFSSPDMPFAGARVGDGIFVSEVDESDGSIAVFDPQVAVLLNVSLDHKSMDELRQLFGDFIRRAKSVAANFDDPLVKELAFACHDLASYGIESPDALITVVPSSIVETPTSISATVIRHPDTTFPLTLPMPGRHNLSNALAAIAAAHLAAVDVGASVRALATFAGLARRFDVIGTSPAGITVIDDFGHNPEKCAATLRTLKRHPGRVIAFFQPHGFGPLRQMGRELAETFSRELGPDDLTLICDPLYFGGTVERDNGAARVANEIRTAGGRAEHHATRELVAERIVELAQPGDRIAVMGARDDTLTEFAKGLLARLG